MFTQNRSNQLIVSNRHNLPNNKEKKITKNMNYFKNNLASWPNEENRVGLDKSLQERFKHLSLISEQTHQTNTEFNRSGDN